MLYPSIAAIPAGLWRWPNFTPAEIACKGDGSILIDTEFLDDMQVIRLECGFPFIVNSWYRSPAYNLQVASSGDDGVHTTGRACDIRIYGERALKFHEEAYKRGLRGFGWQQKGPIAGRYIHVDGAVTTPDHPRPAAWTY